MESATSWIEIQSVLEARADIVANQAELAWLTRYPLPNKITVEKSKELLAELKTMMATDYGIPLNSISIRNPQANIIVETVNQSIGNIICTFQIQETPELLGRNSLIYYVCHMVYSAHYYAA